MPVRTLWTGLAVFVLDAASKRVVESRLPLGASVRVIPGFLDLTYVLNPGAALGILAHRRELFILVGAAAIGLMGWYAIRREGRQGLAPWALGLLLGGAAGNLLDRLRYGKVVDFMDFHFRRWHFPVFNLADCAIVLGVGLLLVHLMQGPQRKGRGV